MQRLLWSFWISLVFVVPVQAHFLFLVPSEDGNSVQLVFSEELAPDSAVPITKVSQTELFEMVSNNPLKMTQKENAYVVSLPKGNSHTLGGVCVYGVLEKGADPFLLCYYPKAILGPGATNKAWEKLPLEILVSGGHGKVIYQGKPVAEAEVIVTPSGEEDRRTKTTTAADGSFAFEVPKSKGLLSIRARHIEKKSGTHRGKDYKEAKHYATLVISSSRLAPLNPASAKKSVPENPAATKLLSEARQARMEWDNFPGFTANLIVNHNGTIVRGKVNVSKDAQIDLEGFEDQEVKSWLRRQLGSLVSHRLSNGTVQKTPCAFLDDNKNHPLGRKIQVLNNELHSSYRIRDRQIIEVNRSMKAIRFTITVLHNYETPEKKFVTVHL